MSETKKEVLCPHTGQLITEHEKKVFGLTLMQATGFAIVFLTSMIVFIYDEKARRQTIVQGSIAILCVIAYGIFLRNYEKSKQMYLGKPDSSNKQKAH